MFSYTYSYTIIVLEMQNTDYCCFWMWNNVILVYRFQYSNGEVWVQFDDATQVGVKSTSKTVKFVDQQGQLTRYRKTVALPEVVKSRLEKVPAVLEHLLRNNR